MSIKIASLKILVEVLVCVVIIACIGECSLGSQPVIVDPRVLENAGCCFCWTKLGMTYLLENNIHESIQPIK